MKCLSQSESGNSNFTPLNITFCTLLQIWKNSPIKTPTVHSLYLLFVKSKRICKNPHPNSKCTCMYKTQAITTYIEKCYWIPLDPFVAIALFYCLYLCNKMGQFLHQNIQQTLEILTPAKIETIQAGKNMQEAIYYLYIMQCRKLICKKRDNIIRVVCIVCYA